LASSTATFPASELVTMKIDVDRLADRWIAERFANESRAATNSETAEDLVLHLPYDSPDAAWAFVEQVFEKTSSVEILGLLGAGVLETLIEVDSANAVLRLRKLIENHPIAADVLHGVWQGDIPPSVWQEIIRLRSA